MNTNELININADLIDKVETLGKENTELKAENCQLRVKIKTLESIEYRTAYERQNDYSLKNISDIYVEHISSDIEMLLGTFDGETFDKFTLCRMITVVNEYLRAKCNLRMLENAYVSSKELPSGENVIDITLKIYGIVTPYELSFSIG